MRRLIGYAVGAALLLLLVCSPVLAWNLTGEEASEDTTIQKYVAEFDLAADGELRVTETLDVYVPGNGKHGIFRFWDRADPSAPGTRRTPENIVVTRDGQPEPFDELTEQDGRFTVAKIGSTSVTLDPGVHTYVIDYTVQDAIEPGTTGERSQFYWNLIPSGWQQDIDEAELTVNLPVDSASTVQCGIGVGTGDDLDGCPVEGAGTSTLVVRASDLDRNTPVTIKTGLDLRTPSIEDELPWSARWDRVLGTSVPALVVIVLLGLVAGVAGLLLGARTREPKPGFPLQYAPPEGIGPAQAAYILTEQIGQDQYVATLMHAAERGAISLDKTGDAWTITDKAGAQGWAGLDPISTQIAHLLSGPGTSFVAAKTDVGAGQRLKTEIADFASGVEKWATSSGHLTNSALGPFGGLLVLAGLVLAVLNTFVNPFSMTTLGLIPGLFAVGGLALLIPGAATMRTASGRDLWSRVGGFHRVLSTPSSKDRFDFSGRQELYTAYVPWAVALGCAKEWAQKYRTEVGSEPPAPSWLPAYAGVHTFDHVTTMVNDFDSTLSGAISSYNATQSSSSGGGGGFSGGGGGGGGGGVAHGEPARTGQSQSGEIMVVVLIVIVVLVVGLLLLGVVTFNRLRASDVGAQEALGGIDVQLTRRAELVPNLVETVKGYASHEKGVFEEVTTMRTAVTQAAQGDDVAAKAAADAGLQQALVRVNAVAENYPDLKANTTFLELQKQLADTENQIAFARQYYNDATATLNKLVVTIPWLLLAGVAGVRKREFYNAPVDNERAPQVEF